MMALPTTPTCSLMTEDSQQQRREEIYPAKTTIFGSLIQFSPYTLADIRPILAKVSTPPIKKILYNKNTISQKTQL